jgi:uncharacterized RDD family membrane protein YckC
METVKVNTSQHIDIDYPVAGLGERVAAYLIDFAMFIILYFLTFVLLGVIGANTNFRGKFIVVIIIWFACYIFYDLICEIAFNGQSLGKKLLKIKVVSLDGAQPSIGQYFIRWIFRIIDFTLSMNLLGFLFVAISDQKQRVGDIVAGTTVIKTTAATKISHIAFHPTPEDYEPVFANAMMLNDGEVELIHEVVRTYYLTYNPQVVYSMAEKLTEHLGINIPEGMNEMQFLKTVSADYIQLTSRAV